MMTVLRYILTITLFVFMNKLSSQESSAYKYKVWIHPNHTTVWLQTGFITKIQEDSIVLESLDYEDSGKELKYSIHDVHHITYRKKHRGTKGIVIGMATGAVTGLLYHRMKNGPGCTHFNYIFTDCFSRGLGGALLGGIIGGVIFATKIPIVIKRDKSLYQNQKDKFRKLM